MASHGVGGSRHVRPIEGSAQKLLAEPFRVHLQSAYSEPWRIEIMTRKYLGWFPKIPLRTSVAVPAVLGGALLAASAISPATTAEVVKQGLRLAFFCSGGSNDYQLTGIKAAKETAAKYGASLQWYDAQFDTAKQLNQIMAATSSGNFDGFVIEAVNASTVCSSVKAALQKNIVVAMTNVQACDTAYEVPYPGTVIMTGGQAASVYEAWFRKRLRFRPGRRRVRRSGGADHPGKQRACPIGVGQIEVEYPKWKLVGFEDTGYNAGPALKKTQDILQAHPKVKIIFSNYAGQTPGAIAALKSAGMLGKVKIYDMGGDKVMFNAVKEGTVDLTLIFFRTKKNSAASRPWSRNCPGFRSLTA